MSHGGWAQKVIIAGVAAAIITSVTALIVGSNYPATNNNVANTVSYDAVAPYIEEYLVDQDIVTPSGTINVPNTNDNNGSGTTTITVQDAIKQLLETGELEYLKGDKGDTGATGADGVDGTDGVNGTDGKDGIDGADGTGSNLDTDTTVASSRLTLADGILSASITDSEGEVISSNEIDLNYYFATQSSLGPLSARLSNLENTSYASENWVLAQNYLTSSGLATYLENHDYITGSALGTILSSYLLKNQFAATLNSHLLAGNGIAVDKDVNGNAVISSLHNAEIFEMVNNYLSVQNPDTNKIYVDLDESPMKEYIYLGGVGGAPTDPSDPAAWSKVGSVTIDLTPYSTTDQMNTAINNALTNQLNDLANHSNLAEVLSNYVTTGDMTTAITAATDDMAAQSWVNAQGFLTSSSLVGNATETWVYSQNFAHVSDLDAFYAESEVDYMLSQKADQSALDSTNLRVSSLESAFSSKQDKLTAGQNITISGSVISANVDLSNYATRSYVDSQDYLTNTSALSTYATQNFVVSQGYITNAALDGYATEGWVETHGYLTSTNLSGYAKESWVKSQNYLTSENLISYLTTNNYATDADVAAMLAAADSEYVAHQEFAETLRDNLKAGDGITITADNTISATMFVMTTNRLTVPNPDPGKIYVETGDDSSSPVSQYIYIGGRDGAPADPTQPAAWLKVGDLSGVDLSHYSTTDQMNAAIANAIDEEVAALNKIYATTEWVDDQGFLKVDSLNDYASEDWVSENYLASSALDGYAQQSWVTSQGYLKSSALSGYAMQSWVTSQGYLTADALVGNATQTWVKNQGYITADAASATYVTQSSLAATLAGYQPIITGAATTITTANLTPNMLLQSDANGKVAASSVSFSSLQTALSDIATLKTQLAALDDDIDTLEKDNSMGSWGEIDTGKTFRGKTVYRQDFTLYVNADANLNSDLELIGIDNYVDDIVSAGGWWTIGYQTERWQIPSGNGDSANYAYVIIHGSGNRLKFRSKANNKRSSAQAIIIVEYTRK